MSLLKKLGPLAGLAGLAALVASGGTAAPVLAAGEAAGLGAGATGLTLGGGGAALGMGGGTGLTLGGGASAGLLGGAEAAAPIMGGGTGLLSASGLPELAPPSQGLAGLMKQAKPYSDAAGAAKSVIGMFQDAPVNAPQPGSKTDGGAASAQLFNSIQQGDLQRMQEEMAKRQKMNSMFGGGNGWTT